VTLVAGTNHPDMYEFEWAVKNFVAAHPGLVFTYTVNCDYAPQLYSQCPIGTYPAAQLPNGAVVGPFAVFGAFGNPFCLWPAPARLRLSLFDPNGAPVTAQQLFAAAPVAFQLNFHHSMIGNELVVGNGALKGYAAPVHVANSCWAAVNQATVASHLYARSLQHCL
jgi:hypothetical protein